MRITNNKFYAILCREPHDELGLTIEEIKKNPNKYSSDFRKALALLIFYSSAVDLKYKSSFITDLPEFKKEVNKIISKNSLYSEVYDILIKYDDVSEEINNKIKIIFEEYTNSKLKHYCSQAAGKTEK